MKALKKKFEFREQYLYEAAKLMNEKLFKPVGDELPKDVEFSASFPARAALPSSNGGSHTVGVCYPREMSEDKHILVHVSPLKGDELEALAILAHELCHASDNCSSGHRNHFRKTALGIGLEGKMTSTHAGDQLIRKLKEIVDVLGEYPQVSLAVQKRVSGTRNLLIECVNPQCGLKMRTSKKQIDEGIKLNGWAVCSKCTSLGSLRFNIDDSIYTRQEYIDIVRAWEKGMFTEEDEE